MSSVARKATSRTRGRMLNLVMEKALAKFRSFEEAERADRDFYKKLTPQERLAILLELLTMPLSNDSKEFIALLNSHDVEYLIVAWLDAQKDMESGDQETKRFELGKQERRMFFFSCFPIFPIQVLIPVSRAA